MCHETRTGEHIIVFYSAPFARVLKRISLNTASVVEVKVLKNVCLCDIRIGYTLRPLFLRSPFGCITTSNGHLHIRPRAC